MYHSVPLLLAAKGRAARIARERSAVTELLLTPALIQKGEKNMNTPHGIRRGLLERETGIEPVRDFLKKRNIFEKFGIVL